MSQTPRVSGAALRAADLALRSRPIRNLVAKMLRSELGIEKVLGLDESQRGPLPTTVRPIAARSARRRPTASLGPLPSSPEWPRSAAHWTAPYRAGTLQPSEAVKAALDGARALAARPPGFGPILSFDDERALEAAARSDARWARQAPLGRLDGVPVLVKEELAVAGLPRRLGSMATPDEREPRDGTLVARLRQAGAIVLGTTPMTEFGLSPLGFNPHRTMPRNPHDERRLAGGSSTGSGVGVATGLVPVAIGSDGGGSIRTPACFTGVFGLKPTFGRLSRAGGGLGTSVGAFGPIGASAADLAALIDACAGEDPDDEVTARAPALGPAEAWNATGHGVRGMRLGVDEGEWAAAPPEIASVGREALRALEKEGAELVSVSIPLAPHTPAIGYLTIALEEMTLIREIRATRMELLSTDLRIMLRALSTFAVDDYLDGQRLRAGLRRQVADVLRGVDALALPTVACTAPIVTDEQARDGFADPPVLDATCRYAFLANLAGLPAGTAPVGIAPDGMPVGLQIVGDAWDEPTVIAVLAHLERTEVAKVRRPKVTA